MGDRVRALVFALAVPPLLEVVSVSRLVQLMALGPHRTDIDDQALACWVDQLLGRLPWPWRRTCLRRSAVLYGLLRRAGRPVELWIGVRRDHGSEVTAHAWLTLEGVPYLEANPDHPARHTPIARFGARS